jgi:hypothetical protein
MTKIPNGKSHGLVMFIDWSGSMQDKIHATIKQLLNLVMFCKKVNIPFDVYAFTSQWGSDQDYYIGSDKGKPMQKPAVGDICLNGGFHLLNLFNHKMTASEYVEMANRLLGVYADNASIYKNSPIPYGLRLGGTPLNHTIVAAFEMIPEFKKANKIDIVNAVFLTDGESGNLGDRYSYYDTNKFLRHEDIQPSGSRRQMFRDPITKATVEVHRAYGSYGNQSAEETTALLKLLKQRANCNLMGFFIAGSRDIRSALESFASLTKKELDMVDRRVFVEQQMVVFRKEKTHVIENVGYDEYYLIGSSSLDTDDDELEVKSNTTRGLVSAFSKYTGGKVTSRIILNRFIKLIA